MRVKLKPVAAAVLTALLGVLELLIAVLSDIAFDVARSSARLAGYDFAYEAAAGTAVLVTLIVQALLCFVLAFAWLSLRGLARQRLVRFGVRAATGALLVSLFALTSIIVLGSRQDAFRGSTIFFTVMFLLLTALVAGAHAFTALALSDQHRAG